MWLFQGASDSFPTTIQGAMVGLIIALALQVPSIGRAISAWLVARSKVIAQEGVTLLTLNDRYDKLIGRYDVTEELLHTTRVELAEVKTEQRELKEEREIILQDNETLKVQNTEITSKANILIETNNAQKVLLEAQKLTIERLERENKEWQHKYEESERERMELARQLGDRKEVHAGEDHPKTEGLPAPPMRDTSTENKKE